MSFILDALKKSETDRQRQGGPALFEVKVAAPRSALPPWAIAIGVLFAANLAVVGWLLLRHGAATPGAPAPAAGATAAPRAQPSPAPAVMVAAPAAASVTAPVPAPASPASAAPTSSPAVVAGERAPPAAVVEPAASPDDYAPAQESPPPGMAHVQRGTAAGVPLYQQLTATAGNQIPQLRLDLLAYADKAEDRWVLVNMHKLHEGDAAPEGARVERITPDGAVLSWHGQQFLLTRE